MLQRLPSKRSIALTLAGLAAAYVLLGWFLLPRVLESQSEAFVADHGGYRLSMERPTFNPLTLRLTLSNLHLDEPDGKPLLSFRELEVKLSVSGLFKRALAFSSIRLDDPRAVVVVQRDGQLNWMAWVDALGGKEAPKEKTENAALPRLDIGSFVLTGGQIEFSDLKAGFNTRINPLELELSDISTLPNDDGRYRITARTAFGTRVAWQGQATLNPLALAGGVEVEDLELLHLAPYLRDLPIAPPEGNLRLSANYRVAYDAGRFDVSLDDVDVKLAKLKLVAGKSAGPALAAQALEVKKGRFSLADRRFGLGEFLLSGSRITLPRTRGAPVEALRLGALTVTDAEGELGARNIALGRITLKDGQIKAVRDAAGRIDLADAVQAALRQLSKLSPSGKTGAKANAKTQAPAKPWRYQVKKVELTGFSAEFRDTSTTPAADFLLNDIAASVENVSDKLDKPLPVEISLRSRDGGNLAVSGQVVPAIPSADLQLKLSGLAVGPVQPYLASVAKLEIQGGEISSAGHVAYDSRGAEYKGDFAFKNLRVVETGTKDVFLAWDMLGTPSLKVTPQKLGIGELGIDHLKTKLIINKDRTVNISRILQVRQPPAAPGAASAVPAQADAVQALSPPPSAAAAAAAPAAPFAVKIGRIRIKKSEMDFADYSLILPFATRIHHLHGFIDGVASPAVHGPAVVKLDGVVDDYGVARARGEINLLDPTAYTNLKVNFGNVEMTRLTPYSGTFAGRKIASGKLSLDLAYKIVQRQLVGDNRIVIDRLTLGERVESPSAKELPLDLAIAILEDSDGRIDLGLPVTGDLNDPDFSYGSIVWKAVLNVFEKIVTAPFRALGALFGGGGSKVENVYMDAGSEKLSPPEREKIGQVVEMLNKRPSLRMVVHGVYSEADRVALQGVAVRRAVALKVGEHVREGEDPGPIDTHRPKVQSALEGLFSDKFGGGELASLKEGFRTMNPGQLEESMTGKMAARLKGVFQRKRALDDKELAQLRDADFYAVLFHKLRDAEPLANERLVALAQARGAHVYAALKAANAPEGRISLAAPEKVESEPGGVPVKFDLEAAPKQAAVPAGN